MPPTNALCTSRPEPEPEPEPEIEEPGVFGDVIDPSTSASIGAGITGAVAGGILADRNGNAVHWSVCSSVP